VASDDDSDGAFFLANYVAFCGPRQSSGSKDFTFATLCRHKLTGRALGQNRFIIGVIFVYWTICIGV
jgi:hypothetical protein